MNGRRLSQAGQWSQPCQLYAGDRVRIGRTELTACIQPQPSTATAAAVVVAAQRAPTANKPSWAVLDTNVLLDGRELRALQSLVRGDSGHGASGSLRLVLPFIVMQELDGLKCSTDRELARRARQAVSWLHGGIAKKGAPPHNYCPWHLFSRLLRCRP